jgi:hypothetical protein
LGGFLAASESAGQLVVSMTASPLGLGLPPLEGCLHGDLLGGSADAEAEGSMLWRRRRRKEEEEEELELELELVIDPSVRPWEQGEVMDGWMDGMELINRAVTSDGDVAPNHTSHAQSSPAAANVRTPHSRPW